MLRWYTSVTPAPGGRQGASWGLAKLESLREILSKTIKQLLGTGAHTFSPNTEEAGVVDQDLSER